AAPARSRRWRRSSPGPDGPRLANALARLTPHGRRRSARALPVPPLAAAVAAAAVYFFSVSWNEAKKSAGDIGGVTPSLCTTPTMEDILLGFQSDHRVDPRRLARRHPAREERHQRERDADDDVGDRIGGADAVEERREEAHAGERAGEADADAEEAHAQPLPDDHRDDATAARAERQADADLAAPLCDLLTEDAVDLARTAAQPA